MSVSQQLGMCRAVLPARRIRTLAEDVRAGLLEPPRMLPPKYFYDAHGSALFDRICETEEYYPTRTEDALLAQYAGNIIGQVSPRHILELGSGTSRKTRHLLSAFGNQDSAVYWPFDVCREVLEQTVERLGTDYPWLEINPLWGDYSAGLENLPCPDGGCLYVFLGGTLGNFDELEAIAFLTELSSRMSGDDRLLLGLDRVKPDAVLCAAYDDAEGVTAAFNRNLLSVLNRELDGNFRPEVFDHRAIYNEEKARIEMYLVADGPQEVYLESIDTMLRFEPGETILTEISRKFTLETATRLLYRAGFDVEQHYSPENQYFSLLIAMPK